MFIFLVCLFLNRTRLLVIPDWPLVDWSRWETSVPGEVSTREYRNSDGTVTVQSDYILVPSRETHKETLTCVTSYNEEVFTDSVTLDIQCKSGPNRISRKKKERTDLDVIFLFSLRCFVTRRTRGDSGRLWRKLVHQPRERPAELPSWRQPQRVTVPVAAVSATPSHSLTVHKTGQSSGSDSAESSPPAGSTAPCPATWRSETTSSSSKGRWCTTFREPTCATPPTASGRGRPQWRSAS